MLLLSIVVLFGDLLLHADQPIFRMYFTGWLFTPGAVAAWKFANA